MTTAALQEQASPGTHPVLVHGQAELHHADCFHWLEKRPANSIHAVITDPPDGLVEYSDVQQRKLREDNGGVWRQPPSYDGHRRSPLPRFTTLRDVDLQHMRAFFERFGAKLSRILVPGAHIFLSSNPPRLPHSRFRPGRFGPRYSRRRHPPGHDHAWRRPTKRRSRGIFRRLRHAPQNPPIIREKRHQIS